MKGYPQCYQDKEIVKYKPDNQISQLAVDSLIERKKYQASIHSTILCARNSAQLTLQEKQNLIIERKRYLEYLKKTYIMKIPQELRSQGKFKNAYKVYQSKIIGKTQEKKKKREKPQSNAEDKKIKSITEKGRKKIKLNQQKASQKKQQAINEPIMDIIESQSINLQNSMVGLDQYGQDYDE